MYDRCSLDCNCALCSYCEAIVLPILCDFSLANKICWYSIHVVYANCPATCDKGNVFSLHWISLLSDKNRSLSTRGARHSNVFTLPRNVSNANGRLSANIFVNTVVLLYFFAKFAFPCYVDATLHLLQSCEI